MEHSSQPRRAWLPEHFIVQVLPNLVEKPLFGKNKIRFGPLLIAQAKMYEYGAILGRARADQVETLLKISFDEWDNMSMFRDQAEFHSSLMQKNPDGAYGDLIWELLYSHMPREHRLEMLTRDVKLEKDYETSIGTLRLTFMWGIGFGAKLPNETERLYRNVHESPITGPYPAVPEFRIKAEPHPTIITLEQLERAILQETAIFVSTNYPELMATLRL